MHVQPMKALILDEFDRAAPKGMGHAKVGGNYGGVLRWSDDAAAEGFGVTLHLDSARHEEVEEFSLCGFLGVKDEIREDGQGGNKPIIVQPVSPSTINSVTSDSVQRIAEGWGWKVEKRPVAYAELSTFSEVLGAGTALGLIPIRSITRRGTKGQLPPGPRVVSDGEDSEVICYIPDEQKDGGPVFQKLLKQLKGIQSGKVPDDLGWRFQVQASDMEVVEQG